MIRALLLVAVLGSPVAAETATVLSGEHGSFTRLVIDLPEASGWTVGRTSTGYAFAATSAQQPDYDLSRVWQRIPRDRLKALRVNPDTGALDLQLGCDCHVFPFEYQPNLVVLDIRPGPAPATSAFEAAFVAADAGTNLTGAPSERGGYDWRLAKPEPRRSPDALPLPLDTGTVSLDPMREALIEEIARGAAQGVVDLTLPKRSVKKGAAPGADLPWANIRIGEAPGIAVLDPDAFVESALPQSACAADDLLDLAAWGDGQAAVDLLVRSRTGLYGEFDRPDPDAVLRSVRILLYLGFGAEARQQATLLDSAAAPEALGLYLSMSRLVDAESDPQTPFATMLDCDGPAALWAALAHDRFPPGKGLNRDAILRSFLALPAHLRRTLGVSLAEKFLAADDAESARLIRDAIERAPQSDAAVVARLDAEVAMQAGDSVSAQTHAESAVAQDGDDTANLITLVESHFRDLRPLDPVRVAALLSLQGESDGTDAADRVARAVVLGLALSGQSDAAFRHPAARGAVLADLWRVVEDRADDDDFLRFATIASADAVPEVPGDLASKVAGRLLALGFPDAALNWLGPVGAGDSPNLRLLAAEAELARGDGTAAVALLEGIDGAEAEALRAAAQVRVGNLDAAAGALAAAGEDEAAGRLRLWQGDWDKSAPDPQDPWALAASLALPRSEAEDIGLLARGSQSVDDSLAARAAIEALLAKVPALPES